MDRRLLPLRIPSGWTVAFNRFVEIVRNEGVFVLSETYQTVLQGRLYEAVAPCLDGRTAAPPSGRSRGALGTARRVRVGPVRESGVLHWFCGGCA